MNLPLRWTAAVAALLAAFSLSGCLALAVPSLAYQGYQYEKQQKQDEQASTSETRQRKDTTNTTSDEYYDTE